LTHRTFKIGNSLINVFDSRLGADQFLKKNQGDVTVVVRGKTYFSRRGELELTVNIGMTETPKNAHLIAAAKSVSQEIEHMILREQAA
jgi:hypothetical protein